MKHWYLTFCLVIAAFFGSVGVGFGDGRCQIALCENVPICTYARNIEGTGWETRSDSIKYVREAKKRGLTCGLKTT